MLKSKNVAKSSVKHSTHTKRLTRIPIQEYNYSTISNSMTEMRNNGKSNIEYIQSKAKVASTKATNKKSI